MEPEIKKEKKHSFIGRHEKAVSFAAFIAGFIWDGVTLRHVSLKDAGIILGAYLFVIAVSIIVFNSIHSKGQFGFFARKIVAFIPYLIQFMFGTLFNAAFIFYTQSAELYSSWPFILFLIVVVLVNELLHKRHTRLAFQLVMFFLATFLYFVFSVPIIFGELSTAIFLLSGVISLLVLFTVMYFLARFARNRFMERHVLLVTIIVGLFGLLNALYFYNIIPPIPLALKTVAIYHSLRKEGSNYYVTYEPSDNSFWSKDSRIFHSMPGDSVYVFTAVFAPASVIAPIVHEWWHLDDTTGQWQKASEERFPIVGGRDNGYRGYTFKKDPEAGKWEVVIKTVNGGRLGSVHFEVVSVTVPPKLESEVE